MDTPEMQTSTIKSIIYYSCYDNMDTHCNAECIIEPPEKQTPPYRLQALLQLLHLYITKQYKKQLNELKR